MTLKTALNFKTVNIRFAGLALAILLIQSCASNAPVRTGSPMPSSIELPFQNLTPGFSYLQEVTGPGVTRNIVWVYIGREDDLYRWDLFRGGNTEGEPWQAQWLTEHGAIVKYEQSLSSAQWSPHNCFRVIGECEFQYTDPYGYENSYVRDGSFDGRTWSYQLFRIAGENRDLITNGEVRFNQAGIEIFHEYYTGNNGYQISKVTQFF